MSFETLLLRSLLANLALVVTNVVPDLTNAKHVTSVISETPKGTVSAYALLLCTLFANVQPASSTTFL